MELKINWHLKRAKHVRDRMLLRGISFNEFVDCFEKGRKIRQDKYIFESFWRYYSVVYEQRIYPDKELKKIYPITVKMW